MNSYIDHTNLKAYATLEDIKKLCDEAIKYHFAAVCVNPSYVDTAKGLLKNSTVLVATVIGFPLGASTLATKEYEAIDAINNGADEIDMVINIGRFKDGQYDYVLNEIKKVKEACGDKVLKVIIETALLKDWEIEKATNIVLASGADFIKTSTGFSYRGADKKDIEIFNKVIGSNKLKIKAAGGIKTMDDIKMYVEMGVERFGTSSSVAIFTGEKIKNDSSY